MRVRLPQLSGRSCIIAFRTVDNLRSPICNNVGAMKSRPYFFCAGLLTLLLVLSNVAGVAQSSAPAPACVHQPAVLEYRADVLLRKRTTRWNS